MTTRRKRIGDLETDELTYEFGAETAKCGVSVLDLPDRCICSREFMRGYVFIRTDGKIISLREDWPGHQILTAADFDAMVIYKN